MYFRSLYIFLKFLNQENKIENGEQCLGHGLLSQRPTPAGVAHAPRVVTMATPRAVARLPLARQQHLRRRSSRQARGRKRGGTGQGGKGRGSPCNGAMVRQRKRAGRQRFDGDDGLRCSLAIGEGPCSTRDERGG
jgi:hypothetical protein